MIRRKSFRKLEFRVTKDEIETVKFPDLYFNFTAPFKNLILFGATCHKLNFRMKVDRCIWIAADSNLVSTWEELQVYRFFMYLDIYVQQFFMYLYMYNRSSCTQTYTVVLYFPIHVQQFFMYLYVYSSSCIYTCTFVQCLFMYLYMQSSSLHSQTCTVVFYVHVQQFMYLYKYSSSFTYRCTIVHVPTQHSCTLYVQQEIYIFEK